MSELENVKRPDGKTCPAYLSRPAGDVQGGIVVIQEWWGLNEQIKQTADRLAAAGFVALVPDLYRGKIAQDADEANHCMGSLDFMDATDQDIRGCVQHLKAHLQDAKSPTKVAVSGFCMGGALTILSAAKIAEMDAGVCFYGIPPDGAVDPSSIAVPMQFHFANTDDWCTPDAVNALEKKLQAGDVPHEIFRYDAQHAFMNETRPEVYDEGCAKQAWDRALTFFAAHFRARS